MTICVAQNLRLPIRQSQTDVQRKHNNKCIDSNGNAPLAKQQANR